MTRPFQQRKGQRTFTEKSADDADRSRDIAFQIGVSKAIRNVVVNALQTFADFALDEARGALVGKIGRDLERWRGVTLKRLEERGVELKRVEAVMGRVASEWLAPDIAQVIAMMKSVLDGMATIDETFPPLAAQAAAEGQASKLDQFAKDGDSDAAGGRPSDETPEAAETHPNRPPGSKV
jgi:hypothetical protein